MSTTTLPRRPSLLPPPSGTAWLGDLAFRGLCTAAALFVVLIAAAIVVVLTAQAMLALRTIGLGFFFSAEWNASESKQEFGALAFVWGTVATSVIAMIVAVPLGVGTATYLAEIASPRVRVVGSFLVEMLAVVPSVVYGFWGLFVLAPIVQSAFDLVGGPNQGGVGVLSSGLLLALMVVPYVASVSFDSIRSVPRAQREGALALGATRWQTIWSVVLPYARPGIVGGCFLALGRALGETMAVTMMIGNKAEISLSPFAMGNSIASVIANQFTEATYDLQISALVALGLVLLAVNVGVNAFARLLLRKVANPDKPFLPWASRKKPAAAEVSAPAEAPPEVAPKPAAVKLPANPGARTVDRVMGVVLAGCLAFTAGCLLLILGHIVYNGVTALDLDFFTRLPGPPRTPEDPPPVPRVGMANAIYGSLVLMGLSALFAVPVGLLTAVFLAEYRSDYLGPTVRFIGELLGGVPSIVIGMFAYTAVVRPMSILTDGRVTFSAWAGAFALGVMMIPVVMRASEEALRLVPVSLRQASYALGAAHWQTVLTVTVPAALPAIITAVFLAVARVAGETAPLLMTAFNNKFWPRGPGDATPSLPRYIFDYATSPAEDWHRQAWAAALVLLSVVMLLNFGVRYLAGKRIVAATD